MRRKILQQARYDQSYKCPLCGHQGTNEEIAYYEITEITKERNTVLSYFCANCSVMFHSAGLFAKLGRELSQT